MKWTFSFAIGLMAIVSVAACSGNSGSPSSPSALPSGTTTIAGTAQAAGTTGGLSFGPLSHEGSDGPLEVCVVGTDICAVADASGHFELVGNFVGDVQLEFSGQGHSVVVTVHDVQPGEIITVRVTLNGNAGTLDVESRQGEGTERVQLCHRTGNGSYRLIEVSVSAEEDHLDHGDGYPGGEVPDTDPVVMFDDRCNVLGPEIDIEKATNGQDADRGSGPRLLVGDPVTWTYEVTNTGNVPLTNIVVSDSEEGAVDCPRAALEPGESMTCTLEGTAEPGRYRNVGTVTASTDSIEVTDSDPSRYVGQEPEDDEDGDGPANKIELCHRTGNGTFRLIEVSVDAERAHLAHGDGYPGQGQFDASCNVSAS